MLDHLRGKLDKLHFNKILTYGRWKSGLSIGRPTVERENEETSTCVSHCAMNWSCLSFPYARLSATLLLFLISIIYPLLPLQQVSHNQQHRERLRELLGGTCVRIGRDQLITHFNHVTDRLQNDYHYLPFCYLLITCCGGDVDADNPRSNWWKLRWFIDRFLLHGRSAMKRLSMVHHSKEFRRKRHLRNLH